MATLFRLIFASAVIAALSGCIPEDSKSNPTKAAPATAKSTVPTAPTAEPQKKEKNENSGKGLIKETFSPPAPTTPSDDPRVIQAKSASAEFTAALANVRARVTALRSKLQIRAAQDDMKAVVLELREMTAAGRSDCDAVLRPAEDLREELRHSRQAYEDAAAAYRRRASGYKEKVYRETVEATAEQLERLATDTPRRIRLTERFSADVAEARDFLAETNRFLHFVEDAVAIMSVAPDAPRPSPRAERIRSYLGQFLDAIDQFQKELLQSPWAKKQSPPDDRARLAEPEKKSNGPADRNPEKAEQEKESAEKTVPKDTSSPKPAGGGRDGSESQKPRPSPVPSAAIENPASVAKKRHPIPYVIPDVGTSTVTNGSWSWVYCPQCTFHHAVPTADLANRPEKRGP